MQQATKALTYQFLAWVSGGPRTYAEAMDAWRTSCPRLTIWEDAVLAGLVRIENTGATRGEARVTLTPKGRVLLSGAEAREAAGV
jgi:hypothetical protein